MPAGRIDFIRLSKNLVLTLGFLLSCGLLPAQPQAGTHVEIVGESQTHSTNATIAGAAPDVARLLQSERVGNDFHYIVFGLPTDAPVTIELGFAELQHKQPRQRVFNVVINSKMALSNFDIIAAAGGPNRAYARKFSITPRRGYLDLHFTGVIDNAKIGYIRIQGRGTDLLVGADPADDFAQSDGAEWNRESGEIFQDDSHKPWRSGVPLGGIGTGKFEILTNGSFSNFTTNNSWDFPTRQVPGTFLAIMAKASSFAGNARVLRVPEPYTLSSAFPEVKNVTGATYKGMYPFANIEFKDKTLPIQVRVEAFSPMIPHNERDSSLPAAILNVELINRNRYPVATAVALSFEDINGRGGSTKKDDQFPISSSLVHTDASSSGVAGVRFSSGEMATGRRSTFLGEYFVGAETSGVVVSRMLNWNPRAREIPWWGQFLKTGRLGKRSSTVETWTSQLAATRGASSAAVVCASLNLAPNERRIVPFIISWYMPNLVLNNKGNVITEHNDYTTSFASAVGVAGYVSTNRERMRAETAEWRDLVTSSSLPGWLQVKLVNSAFPMAANTIHLDDGRYTTLESPQDMRGVLGTMDQRMAAHSFVSNMFPKLDKTELNMFGKAQQADGRITHYIGNLHEVIGNPDVGYGITDWPDLSCSWVMQTVKQYRWSNDRPFLEIQYPVLKKAMQFLKAADKDGDQIPEGGSTYDYEEPAPGAFCYTASCYLGALRAAEAAAYAMNDAASAKQYSEQFVKSQQSMVSRLWNGEYFMKRRAGDAATSSSFVAAMAGDWLTRLSGLAPTMPDDLAVSATASIIRRHVNAFRPVPPMEVSPAGTLVTNQCFLLQDEPYIGCQAIYRGMPDAGLDVLSRVYEVAFNKNKNPWDQSLNYTAPTGEQRGLRSYITSPATWHALHALAGFSLNLPERTLYLNPQVPTSMNGQLHIPIFSPVFWGWLDYNAHTQTGSFRILKVFAEHGEQSIDRIVKYVGFNGKSVGEIRFPAPVPIRPGVVIEF